MKSILLIATLVAMAMAQDDSTRYIRLTLSDQTDEQRPLNYEVPLRHSDSVEDGESDFEEWIEGGVSWLVESWNEYVVQSQAPSSEIPRTHVSECSLDGLWYNGLGSEMQIIHDITTGHILGEYRTAVEREVGSAGDSYSLVRGAADTADKTFALTVVWSGGASTTAWVGQCFIENGREILVTQWLLRSKVSSVDDDWMATRIGHNTFTRFDTTAGPRRADNTNVPLNRA